MLDASDLTVEKAEAIGLFPTLVWKTELKAEHYELINEKVKKKVNELMADKPKLKPGEQWQTDQGLHRLEEFKELDAFIYAAAKGALDFLKVVHNSIEITGCWANVNAPHTVHIPHTHPNQYFTGVYYVQTQEGANTITFSDPRPQNAIIAPTLETLTAENTRSFVMGVKDGDLIVFPSWLIHAVGPNRSDKERISVSFNIMFSSYTETVSTPRRQQTRDTK